MLSTPEKYLFALAFLMTLVVAWRAISRLVRIIRRGYGRPDWKAIPARVVGVVLKTVSLAPTFKVRVWTSILHGLVAWGFMYYLLVNIGDVITGYVPGFAMMGSGTLGDLYRLAADVLSVGVLIGMVALVIRRYVLRPAVIQVRSETLLNPKARHGIARDSAIVAGFIILHVGSRFLGESFELAMHGRDIWQPLASGVAGVFAGMSPTGLIVARHVSWWFALGLIMVFIPYFPYTKHVHLFFGPINFLLSPSRPSMGQLDPLDFEDQSIEQFGASKLEDLPYSSLLDAYACIMCNRCQAACPAYETGKILSPAALEINKRYFLNYEGSKLAAGQNSEQTLLEFAIPAEAVWACTACGACVEVCPVGNEPMRDILEIRRYLVLTENTFPEQFQASFRGMERAANPWNIATEQRLAWAEGLSIPTTAEKPDAELLWWVGCAPATDPRAQKTARAFAEVLQAAGVEYAVLGPEERCNGDPARRSGNEYLFSEMAMANVETLNALAPKRIVTTCPHCLHVLKNEYAAFGGNYTVIHHTQLIEELIQSGRLKMRAGAGGELTFHDPCYLGRQNKISAAPRQSLHAAGVQLREMPRNREQSFCCGAGGGQMWKEEEQGKERVSSDRLREARATGSTTLAVGCPFCMIMLSDASSQEGGAIEVRDVVEIVAERIDGRTTGEGR
jgi:Fe-S oxidoreductase